jgi:hypothetical protein
MELEGREQVRKRFEEGDRGGYGPKTEQNAIQEDEEYIIFANLVNLTCTRWAKSRYTDDQYSTIYCI